MISRPVAPLVGATALAATLGLVGCGGPPAGGDPGGRRLEELAADKVFATKPSGARIVKVVRTKAAYTKPGFEAGGWRGPSVVVTLTSSAPPVDVYRFYGRRAAAAGWRPHRAGAIRVTDAWTKTYPDGAAATLLISVLGIPSSGTARTYVLSGGVAPKLR